MPRKIKVVDITTEAFETAREEDAKEDDVKEDEIKDDYIDTKEEASKQDDLIPITNSVIESTVIEESKNDKLQKELVKCQYCNKSMLGKTLKYSHYQNCQSFKKINKITDKTPKPTEQPPEAPPPPPPTTIAIPKSKPKPKPKPKLPPSLRGVGTDPSLKGAQEEIVEESPTKTIDKPHPRTERMNLIKERYNNLVKNAFNI